MTLDEIVTAYIRDHRQAARREMRFFEIQPDLASAVRHAALCRLPGGGKHPHQWRIPAAVLAEAERRLQACAESLEGSADFDALHGLVERAILSIKGIAELTAYDVAHRIGAFLGKVPALVYLHAGTREGAAALGLNGKALRPDVLPAPFGRLTAAEIEDCLCIYKDHLKGNALSNMHRQRRAVSWCAPRARANRGSCG